MNKFCSCFPTSEWSIFPTWHWRPTHISRLQLKFIVIYVFSTKICSHTSLTPTRRLKNGYEVFPKYPVKVEALTKIFIIEDTLLLIPLKILLSPHTYPIIHATFWSQSGSSLSRVVNYAAITFLTSWINSKCLLFMIILILGKKQKLYSAKSSEYGGWGHIIMFLGAGACLSIEWHSVAALTLDFNHNLY